MANELTATATLAFAKGGVSSIQRSKAGSTFTVNGSKYHAGVQNIGTAEEALSLGDIGTPGWFWILNIDATNYVELRPATGVADALKLKPGEFAMARFASDAVPFMIANTGAVSVEYLIIED